MRAIIAASVVALCLVACGGGGGSGDSGHLCPGAVTTPPDLGADYAPGFVATWDGYGSITVDGIPVVVGEPAYTTITASGVNKLLLRGGGPQFPALVTGENAFELVCFGALSAVGSCSTVTQTMESGTGTIDPYGALTIDASGTLSGCGEFHTFTQTLTGATRRASLTVDVQRVALDDLLIQGLAAAGDR